MWFARIRFSLFHLLSFLNIALCALIATLLMLTLFLYSKPDEENPVLPKPKVDKLQLPKNPFAQSMDTYEKIGQGPFALKWVAPRLELPDLRSELLFFGKNERPDIPVDHPLFRLALGEEIRTFPSNEKIYLTYQRAESHSCLPTPLSSGQVPLWGESAGNYSKGKYAFSPGNHPTSLWCQLYPRSVADEVDISVEMVDEKRGEISTPMEHHLFSLKKADQAKAHGAWEIGGLRVDSTLFIRQKAHWSGGDLFLERHGGEEYAFALGRERIDFLDDVDPYCCFVKAGDFLVWKDQKWMHANTSPQSLDLPLLIVKKIEEKVIIFELWDCDGKSRINLSLVRSREYDPFPDIEQEFKFVGVKTWAQFIVECRKERMILRPHDWLILTKEGWQKLNSPEEIDAFLSHKITGPLFILDQLTKQNGRQTLIGHLFNASRTEMKEIALPAALSPLAHYSAPTLPSTSAMRGEISKIIEGEER